MKQAAICTIGDEILIGQIIDTNSSVIANNLNRIGIRVQSMLSIGDDNKQIIDSLNNCLRYNDIVIVTGGLGPTKDDITKKALATLFGTTEFETNAEQLSIVKSILSYRGIELSKINIEQALVPKGSKVIPNLIGTAPCISLHFSKKQYPHSPILYSLPGVPFETIALLPKVIEDICNSMCLDKIIHKTIATFGIPESTLSDKIEEWENALPKELKLAYLPNPIYGVRLRLSIYDDKGDGMEIINREFKKLIPLLGDSIYGEDDDSLQKVIGDILIRENATLCTAESCTGGRIASLITSVPGSSKYYKGSIISYHNDIKISMLKVREDTIKNYGAVSKECACEMAEGAINALNCDYSIAVSGIAGPDGGTKEKPVGSVWIAIGKRNILGEIETIPRFLRFTSDRERNIERFASNSLNLLRTCIIKH